LYDKIEELSQAEQTGARKELGQCSQAVKDVREQTNACAHVCTRSERSGVVGCYVQVEWSLIGKCCW